MSHPVFPNAHGKHCTGGMAGVGVTRYANCRRKPNEQYDAVHSVFTRLTMTPKEQQKFASSLRKMTVGNVREHSEPSFQPAPLKRAMAVTELERRRQLRAPDTIKKPIAMYSIVICATLIVGAIAVYLGLF